MQVKRIQRGKDVFLVRLPKVVIQRGDRLYISDTPENLKRYETALGATLHNVLDLEHPVSEEHPLSGRRPADGGAGRSRRTPRSTAGRCSQDRFAERHQMVVMAIHRLQSSPKPIDKGLSEIVLASGDVLLAQGAAERHRRAEGKRPGPGPRRHHRPAAHQPRAAGARQSSSVWSARRRPAYCRSWSARWSAPCWCWSPAASPGATPPMRSACR